MPKPDPTAMRIIDANLNRAREALRVMEEYARFGLDDAGLTAAIKTARHALAEAIVDLEGSGEDYMAGGSARAEARGSGSGSARAEARGSGSGALIAHRDIVGDVGRDVATPAEYERSDAPHVAATAAKRLSEALRTIEEYGKTIDAKFAAKIERIRYEGYELERRLVLTVGARERFGHVRLYVVLTESLCRNEWFATAEAALRGGVDCLQLREKDLKDHELLARAKRLSDLCRNHGALFIVNDRPDIAAASGADGVHLGQEDLPVAAVRRLVSPAALVGVSTHTVEQVTAVAAQVPDYIAVGPMFATTTKPQNHIAGPGTLAAAREHTSLPLVAIGGIDEHNAESVLAAAHCCLCVCTTAIAQPDVAAACSRLRAVIDRTIDRTMAGHPGHE